MNLEEIRKDLPIQCRQNLEALYVLTCNEYARRLSILWSVPEEELWWVSDIVGGELHIADAPWSFDMVELRYLVENEIQFTDYMEYWEFVEEEFKDGLERPRINFGSWFRLGARPANLRTN